MVKGDSVAGENGTFKIQSITNSGMGSTGTITVTVPSGTLPCSLANEIYTGPSNMACDYGRRNLHWRCADARARNAWTIVQSNQAPNAPGQVCTKPPIAAILLDAQHGGDQRALRGVQQLCADGAKIAPGAGTIGASSEKVSAVGGGRM